MLEDLLAPFLTLPEEERKAIEDYSYAQTANLKWLPSPGPQTEAYFSKADVLLYGGQGGGGKSDLGLGLSFTAHKRSLILRRKYTGLDALIDRAIQINGTRDGYSGKPPPRITTADGRLIAFGANQHLGDEENFQGKPFDFKHFDEAAHFLEMQIRFHLGWIRSTEPGQQTRALLASNPPLTSEGDWMIGMFRPWLDITHPNPAKHGELRWFITDPDGKDVEVESSEKRTIEGKVYTPHSRSFIPAALSDNPYLIKTDYQSKLDALPEPLRSAVRDGNFMAARQDDALQVIPTHWIREAQARWKATPPVGVPQCAIGVDVAQGGADSTVLAIRHDGWFAPLIEVPGIKTPTGAEVAGLIIQHRRGDPIVVVDVGGGYGGAAMEHLAANGIEAKRYLAGHASTSRTVDRQLGFFNKRAESWWKFREALDPGQPGGSTIMLPDDQILLSDLTSVKIKGEITASGIKLESKDDIKERLGRSPDRGDAVVMAWSAGNKIANMKDGKWPNKKTPQLKVQLGNDAKRRR